MALEAIGGSARVEKEEGKLFIRSGSCPVSTAVTEHPEVCQLAGLCCRRSLGQTSKKMRT
jgi:hypothetical protein